MREKNRKSNVQGGSKMSETGPAIKNGTSRKKQWEKYIFRSLMYNVIPASIL